MRKGKQSIPASLLGLFIGLFVFLGPAAGTSWAQLVKGSIEGSVVDSTGAVVPGAQVFVLDPATSSIGRSISDNSGYFRIPLLAIGTYSVTVSKEGFRKVDVVGVQVNSAASTNVGKLVLEIGQTTTVVEVTAGAAHIETSEAQVTNSLGNSTIAELPMVLGNEGMDNLAVLLPGVNNSRDNNYSNTNGIGFSANGIRGRNNDQQIDGQTNNDNSVAGPGIFLGNTDWVQEYQVTTSNFGVEYSRNSGSVVNIVTKSGSNAWHGDAFVSENSWKTAALTNTQKAFEGLTKVPIYNDEFSGISGGGPIVKDKLFLFAGFDNEIEPSTSVDSTGSLEPTPNGMQTLTSCLPNSGVVQALNKYGPYAIKAGNPTPQGTPVDKTIDIPTGMTGAGTPLVCSNGSLLGPVEFAGVQRALPNPYKAYDWTGRMDYQRSKDRIYGRFLRQSLNYVNATGTGWDGFPGDEPSVGLEAGLDWTRNFGTSVVNNARVSYGRESVEFGGNAYGNTLPQQGDWAQGLASVNTPSGYGGFGYANNLPQGRIINTYQWQDNLSWIHGKHTFKAGANITYQRSPNVFPADENGTYGFSSLYDYVEDIPSSVGITLGNPNLDFREHDNFFYFGDDYKVTKNLTMNLGLSYAYFGQPANLFNTADTKNETGSDPYFDPSLPLSVRVFPKLDGHKKDLGPSIGLAYSPDWGGVFGGSGKTVFRGGYRLTYDPAFYNFYLNLQGSTPQVLSQSLSVADSNANPLPGNPIGDVVRSQLASYLTLGTQDPRSFAQTTVSPSFGPDHVQGWSFGIQRELGPHVVAESRYVGNHGGGLFQSLNGNPYVAGLAASFPNMVPSGVTACPAANAVVAAAIGRENCNLGSDRLRSNSAESDYAGWQNEVRANNLLNQLTLRTSFTWSKTTDNTSEIFGAATNEGTGAGNTIAFAQNPFDTLHGEHSLSGIDFPFNWTLSFVEQIPVFKAQRGFVGRVLGGWGVSGSYIISSGQAYTPTQYCLNYCTGGGAYDTAFDAHFVGLYETARPFAGASTAPVSNVGIYAGDLCNYDGVTGCGMAPNTMLSYNAYNQGQGAYVTSTSNVRVIANGAYADSYYGTPWGSMGRNTLRDANTNLANFDITKNVKIAERWKVEFHTAFLNVFNHPNYSSVDPYLDDAGYTQETTGFGVPSLWNGGSRTIKFGLKILF
jgi:hypothetical protein